jgi:hypothetical protein
MTAAAARAASPTAFEDGEWRTIQRVVFPLADGPEAATLYVAPRGAAVVGERFAITIPPRGVDTDRYRRR